jgi:hypothetical protein
MMKKISFVSGIGAFLFLSLLLPAQTAPAQLSGPTLGTLEGMLKFCGKVNPQAADKYQDMIKRLTKDQPEDKLAELRDSQEYKDSLDQIGKQLGELSTEDAIATCKVPEK